jgi:deoxyribodipyrimidine photo-lyase
VDAAQADECPSRDRALKRLAAFVPDAGRTYSTKRNFDLGEGRHTFVSGLSPYIRHRLITEEEVVAAVLQAHSASSAEKFIQEVCWRTYWKGWLEQRPQVWADYVSDLDIARSHLSTDDALAAEIAAAERGDTGIACFDFWVRELVETGYLHNHARMWFASIWIFTLRLPWVLGADFFYRHLADGDPASNTLSWRWVGGLHTQGKTYLARADNIATYTDGRFNPSADDLARSAHPLIDVRSYPRQPLPKPDFVPDRARIILLVTEEDLSPETWDLAEADVAGVALFKPHDVGPTLSRPVRAFKTSSMADVQTRAAAFWGTAVQSVTTPDELTMFATMSKASAIVTTCIPIGYGQIELALWMQHAQIAGVPILQIQRRWDQVLWPHAKAGFFQLKDKIPAVLQELRIVKTGHTA